MKKRRKLERDEMSNEDALILSRERARAKGAVGVAASGMDDSGGGAGCARPRDGMELQELQVNTPEGLSTQRLNHLR